MNISLLIPRSVLYPSMGFDLVDGIRAGMQHVGASAPHFDIQNIGIAAKNQEIYTRCEQALLNGADIVVAYINPTSVEYVHGLFEANDKLLLVLDSGMHYPSETVFTNAFFVSLQGIICCQATTKIAVESGYINNAFTCSFYDAGYRGPLAFSSASHNLGASIGFNHITALNRSDFTIEPLYEFLNSNQDNGTLAAFCGDMAEDFYNQVAIKGMFQKNPLFVSPYMVEEVWLDKISYPRAKVIASVTWARGIDNPENSAFKEALNKPGKANIFSVIAWEAGIMIASAMSKPEQSVSQTWSEITFDSPRGAVKMNPQTHYLESPVYYCEVVEGNDGKCKLNILKEVEDQEALFITFQQDTLRFSAESNNSWYNAYPCLES